MPEAEDVDIQINPADIEMQVMRSTGAGGQSVNTTDSAVRLTHKPTGIVVKCQQEKSQTKNRDHGDEHAAREALRDGAGAAAQRARRRAQGPGRAPATASEKIRTYNFPQDRLTDHRIELHAPQPAGGDGRRHARTSIDRLPDLLPGRGAPASRPAAARVPAAREPRPTPRMTATTVWTSAPAPRLDAGDFEKKGVDAPRLTAELLLAHALSCARVRLYIDLDRPLGEPELAALPRAGRGAARGRADRSTSSAAGSSTAARSRWTRACSSRARRRSCWWRRRSRALPEGGRARSTSAPAPAASRSSLALERPGRARRRDGRLRGRAARSRARTPRRSGGGVVEFATGDLWAAVHGAEPLRRDRLEPARTSRRASSPGSRARCGASRASRSTAARTGSRVLRADRRRARRRGSSRRDCCALEMRRDPRARRCRRCCRRRATRTRAMARRDLGGGIAPPSRSRR